MSYREEEYLMLSGIQHYMFCRRQWALIHIEQQWEENGRTAEGRVLHSNVHDSGFNEKRGNVITVRAMAVSSPRLGISGECDMVEFRADPNGVSIFGREGLYSVTPIEYKRGSPKEGDCDIMQLIAQAVCLEDMLCCRVKEGCLYYGETHHRIKIPVTDELREKVGEITADMHELFNRQHTPNVRRTKACNACSLKGICLPSSGAVKASAYIEESLRGEGII